MKLSNVGLVYRKELLETLRDRRTLISSILIPILVFPVLILGLGSLGYFVVTRAQRENPRVMVLGAEHAPELVRLIDREEDVEVVPPAPDYGRQIDEKKLRLAVELPPGLEQALSGPGGETLTVRIYWNEGDFRSQSLARQIERVVQGYGEEAVRKRLEARGQPATLTTPFTFKRESAASPEKVTGTIIGMMLPYMVIILALTGAMYPAIDLTAGEKERGTMETLLVSPVQRSEIVTGKFLLVLTVSMATAALSLASFAITIVGGATLLQRISAKLVLVLGVKSMVAVFVLILPLAILFSAALLAIAVMARSYREAQAYLGPLMFVVILPAMVSFLPGVELNTKLALVPILNVSLVAKEVFAGMYPWSYIALIFGSTLLYAGAAIFVAVRQFNREEVLFRT
jgi:sodium transport system permease protein